MTILVTGGTGKTSVRLAQLLSSTSVPFLSVSRSGNPPFPNAPSCKFDWMDESTYDIPFTTAKDIDKAYLVSPAASTDPLPPMRAFIEFAIGKGVKRFVLLTASMIEAGGPLTGAVHAYLMGRGVEWCVVRPTWFMGKLIMDLNSFLPSFLWEGRFSSLGPFGIENEADLERYDDQRICLKDSTGRLFVMRGRSTLLLGKG